MKNTREIKFRAWDKILKRMSEVSCINNFDGLVILDETNYGHVTQKISDVELVQFTGLLDKNGKEIYEGDILKSAYNGNHPVVWRSGGWGLDHSGGCCKPWKGDLSGHHHMEEIIGNIYENPELLK